MWTTNYYNAADVSGGSGPIHSSNIRSNISIKKQVQFLVQLRAQSREQLRLVPFLVICGMEQYRELLAQEVAIRRIIPEVTYLYSYT